LKIAVVLMKISLVTGVEEIADENTPYKLPKKNDSFE